MNKEPTADVTLQFWGAIWVKHFWTNLPHVKRGTRLLSHALPEIPALLVGAGPSLEKNIDEVHRMKGKAIIIAVPKSYKLLLEKGVKPDIVIVTDAKEGQIINNFPQDIETQEGTILITDTVSHPISNERWKNPETHFWYNKQTVDQFPSGARFTEATGVIGEMPQCGNTLNVCWVTARILLDCDPIIWIGADFSWPLGHTQYAGGLPNCYFGDKHLEVVETFIGEKPMETHRVITHYSLQEFMKWLGRKCVEYPGTYYNCTEGGIWMKGCCVTPFKYVVEAYERKNPETGEEVWKPRDFHKILMDTAAGADNA